ncbi:hypothetical protein T06_5379 [Trichinella sp. T6]|nr:hypothetical protein T06_5379 [Trichinella sp. T6]
MKPQSFIIFYMLESFAYYKQCLIIILKFIGFVFKFLIPNYFSRMGIVGNAYIDLTKEERQYVSRRHSLFYPYFSHFEILKIYTNT